MLAGLRPAASGLLLALASVGCGPPAADEPDAERLASRVARWSIFDHLVLYERSLAEGGPFWFDRFEATRAEWAAWLEASGRSGEGAEAAAPVESELPQSDLDWFEARAFARWRFGRLPRFDEWQWAAHGGADYRFPWGDQRAISWANTAELRLDSLTPVGTFESGRQAGGPYDLIGNVGEWTLSPAAGRGPDLFAFTDTPSWLDQGFGIRCRSVRDQPGLSTAWPDALPHPTSWLLRIEPGAVARTVCGHHRRRLDESWQVWGRRPGERGSTTGLRVATDPDVLLQRLCAEPALPDAEDLAALRRFLDDPRNLAVVRRAWEARLRAPEPFVRHAELRRPVGRWLAGRVGVRLPSAAALR